MDRHEKQKSLRLLDRQITAEQKLLANLRAQEQEIILKQRETQNRLYDKQVRYNELFGDLHGHAAARD